MYKYCLIFLLSFQFGKSQILKPFDNEKCQLFSYSIRAKNLVKFEFLNDEYYLIYKSKKIELNPIVKEENTNLLKEFNQKFPEVFSEKCPKFSIYENDEMREAKACNIKFKLLEKQFNFYIFQMSGFEISSFLLYNEKSKISIFTDSYPQILEEGKYIFSINNGLNSTTIQLYKKDYEKYLDYEVQISPRFRISDYFIYKDFFKNLNIGYSIDSKDLKLIEEGKNGKKYEFDENNGCNLKMKIEF